jgi:hypothetical protein
MWRALTLSLLLYITLDFSDPNLPGALNFDLDSSVDGVHTQLRGHPTIAKGATVPAPVFVQEVTTPKTHTAPRRVSVIVRTPAADTRPRALLSRVLASDSPDAH